MVRPGEVRAGLAALGIGAGAVVMLHASVKSIGWVVGGPDAVLRALLDQVGPTGTVMMLAGWEDAPYELAGWPAARQAAYREEMPAFDPATSRADRRMVGVLGEYLRTWPGAARSAHPEGSFVAVGPHAEALLSPHPFMDGFGPGGPLARFVALDGQVLLLGAPLDTVTLLHHAEYLADVPDKARVRYELPVWRDGRRTWVALSELDSSNGIRPWAGEVDYFAAIVGAFLAEGHGVSGRVGGAGSHRLPGRALVAFGRAWMEAEHAAGRF